MISGVPCCLIAALSVRKWNGSRDHRERIYISYDSTNKSCQAGDIEVAEFGHPKDGQGKPVFNYSVAYDRNNRLPLFYEEEHEGAVGRIG